MDEPTTGLDSFNAYELIKLIQKLAFKENKLIIFTIHQPCSEIFALLDKLLILAQSKTIFYGNKEEAYEMFNYNKLPVPENYNPFEYFLEITTQTSIEREDVIRRFPKIKKMTDKSQNEKYEYYVSELAQNFIDFKNGIMNLIKAM